ncbi:hypothetical protein [Rhizobium leguminosarum]|uniref:Uncharacterized protein n=1 Tax=Rhizobium leguminosarum TaxID=384 RepID=A0A2K9ZGE9_RHILE|nr:hypothetical protein [Rhizobium leguminosarum]AUW47325.1 hypothetical protein CUJ84_pRLN3000196 [Rhizobium leguminosarum]
MEDFVAFEKEVDAIVEALPIAKLSAPTLLHQLHQFIFSMIHMSGGDQTKRVAGETISYRVSYLLPWLAGRDWDLQPASVPEMMATFNEADPKRDQFKILLKYSHFCEFVPAVHRGQYIVTRSASGFSLTYPNEAIEEAEAKDIIVSELAINFLLGKAFDFDDRLFAFVESGADIDPEQLVPIATERAQRFAKDLVEQALITDVGLGEVLGSNRATYKKLQASLFGLASVAGEVATMYYGLALEKDGGQLFDRSMSWATIVWEEQVWSQMLEQISGQGAEVIGRFLDAFTYHAERPARQRIGGEGYTPPFYKMGSARFASVDTMMVFCHERNAIQGFMRNQPSRFDELVSHDLEPTLISAFEVTLQGSPELRVFKNRKFKGGEFDMLVIDPVTQHIIICEAKAPMPPQGVRATERLGGRIGEGMKQLSSFIARPHEEKLRVLQEVTGLRFDNPTLHYAILGRACFGLLNVWTQKEITPITLPLMRLAIARLRERKTGIAANLTTMVNEICDEIFAEAKWSWRPEKIELCGSVIEIPLLAYERDIIDRWMRAAGT